MVRQMVRSMELMMAAPHVKFFLPEEAPSGMLARGTYHVKSKFVDDDQVTHLTWEWDMEIKKEWDE